MKWMIYGANGYTGELIARAAAAERSMAVLAGRNADAVNALAKELGCEARVFDADHPQLDGINLVLNCAGPFLHTSGPIVRACLAAGAHYLDITGEIAVFESIMSMDGEAKRRGVTLLPGVGFDVVPTDCLAAMLAVELPDANDLMLALRGGMKLSAGTTKTIIEGLGQGGAVRVNGKITRVPTIFDVREIPFDSGPRLAMTIPWGDVSTAYHTTGIPNIRVYRQTSVRAVARLRRTQWFFPLLSFPPVKAVMKKLASRTKGPDQGERDRGKMEIWGRVSNSAGREVVGTLVTPEGYKLTVLTAIAAVKRFARGPEPAGAFTPAKLFGPDFITDIPGVTVSI